MNPSAWMKSNLAGIGSAAVLTVYAAGYVKTKPAADRFANESDERRRATAPIQPVSNVPVAAEATPMPIALPTPTPVPTTVVKKSAAPKPAAVPEPVRDSLPAIVATPTPTPAPAPPTSPASADSTPQPDKPKEQVGFKDGIYYGWGSSRHGDIQAAVEIKSGRIFSAVITQCLTQYSCSWISPLPPQVVQRQSAEVDYVSGATQSANAFYYAVVQALKQAK